MEKIKLYIGGAINNAPSEFVEKLFKLMDTFDSMEEFEVLRFKEVDKEYTHAEAVKRDIWCTDNCDLMVAICDYPSIGLGIEMWNVAKVNDKLVMAFHDYNINISSMVKGMRDNDYLILNISYTDWNYIPILVRTYLYNIGKIKKV